MTKNPIALDYLKCLGLNPKEVIKHIVVTHWHDDHIKGISDIAEKCPQADIILPNAFLDPKFGRLVGLENENRMIPVGSGLRELKNIFISFKEGSRKKSSPIWAIANLPLFPSGRKKMIALSPSHKEVTRSIQFVADILAKIEINGEQKKVVYNKSNDTSIVLWIEVNKLRALLGSDLEFTRATGCGWDAILSSSFAPKQKAKIFKVPHHGSKTSHHDSLWEKLLVKKAFAVLTPYTSSKLPRKSDANRILGFTSQAYSASQKGTPKKIKRNAAVERTIKEVTKSKRVLESRLGAVRINYNIRNKKYCQTLFGAATHLKNYQF